MDELVERLSQGEHPVEVALRPNRTVEALRHALDLGFVQIRFTGTRGGTELGVRIDRAASQFSDADLVAGRGKVHLEGDLTLNYVPVRCAADIDLEQFAGMGQLRVRRI
jgi:hypothetical protein